MHSRIFQISTKPIDKCDYIEESNYYDHWFLNSVADYVNDSTDRADDIKWLKDCYDKDGLSFGVDENGEYFMVEDKAKFFEPKFKRFQNALQELSTTTLDDFMNGKCGYQLYELKAAYDDKFGFYVDGDEFSLDTLNTFIRYAEIGKKYYIGATIDYHC